MADFPINVVVNPEGAQRGSRRVNRELDSVDRKAKSVGRTITRAFQFAGVTIGVQQLIELTDTFTNLQNRIKTVTDSTEELTTVTQELFKVSQDTRVSFQNTAELYTRTALAVRDLGISQRQTIDFTESLSQAVQLSGASATEANNALIQLSQGLASNTLRGDELRSVLEQLPVVADIIAKQMGATRGELRALGEDGAISAAIILEAFKNAQEELDIQFGELVPTIGQGFTVLNNAIVKVIGNFNTLTGVSEMVARGLIFLADNIDTVLRLAEALVIIIGVKLAQVAIPLLIKAITTLTLAIAANPIGALITGLTAGIALLVAFGDEITLSSGSLVTLSDLAEATGELLSESFEGIADIFEENFGFIADFASDIFSEIDLSVEGFVRFVAQSVDAIVGFFKGSFNAIVAIYDKLPAALGSLFIQTFNGIISTVEDSLNSLVSGFNFVAGAIDEALVITPATFGRLENSYAGAGADLGTAVGKGFREGLEFSGAETALDGLLVRAEQIAQERIERQRREEEIANQLRENLNRVPEPAGDRIGADLRKVLNDLEDQAELLRLNTREREIQSAILETQSQLNRQLNSSELELLDTQLRNVQALTDRASILEQLREPEQNLITTQRTLNQLLEEGTINAEEYGRVLREAQLDALEGATTFEEGFQRSLLNAQDSVGNFADIADTAFTSAFNGATDAIIEFVKTGETNIKSLAATILEQIARIALQQAILGAIGFLTPGGAAASAGAGAVAGAGASAGSAGATPGFQTGGQFTVGGSGGLDSQMVQFRATPGERVTVETGQQQRDAARGRQGSGQQQGGATNIVNVLDPNLVGDFLTSPQGERVLINVMRRNGTSVNQIASDAF